jgi:hypothetical protein
MYTYRASELGGCIKRNVAARRGEKPREVPAKTQAMFDRGNAHEEACLAVMNEQGWGIYDRQKTVTLPINDDCQVVGHLDGLVSLPEALDQFFVGEIKSPVSWNLFQQEQYSPFPSFLIDRYRWQLSVYMVCEEKEALLVTLDDFHVRFHGIELPPYSKEEIVNRVLELEDQAREGLPKLCSTREYPCPFWYLHEEEIGDGDDPFVGSLHEAALSYDRFNRLAKQAKKELDLLMEDRDHYWNDQVRITKSRATRRSVDYKQMAQDYAIDLGAYTKQTEYDTTRVSIRGRDDGEG